MYNIFSILIEVPDYSSSLFFFPKNEEEAIPLGGKKYLGTRKGSTRMILVQNIQGQLKQVLESYKYMYRRCTIYLDY